MIGVTIGVGRWRETAELAAAAARKHTGLEVRVLDDRDWEPLSARYPHPVYLKLHLFDLLDEDDVLYFDADAIHINPWRPADFCGREALVAVVDRFIGNMADESGVPANEYFNAGMMVLNRHHHAPLLGYAGELYGAGSEFKRREQALLNMARKLCHVPLQQLPPKYNHLRFYEDPEFDPAVTVIAHWTPHGPDPAPIEGFCRGDVVLSQRNAARAAQQYAERIPPYPVGSFDGRGIVICAGGPRYTPSAWVLIRLLRQLGCTLPIQVWYRGDEERDDAWNELVAAYGVECVDAEAVRRQHPHLSLGGWELKAYAALHSPFREVMLLDADNVPIRDPAYLFDTSEFRSSGALFWPDGCRMSRGDSCWEAFGVAYRDEPNFESGQLLIDKARCWRALNLCNWYNEHSHFYYRIVYGDKDTFRFAWHALGQPFAMPSRAMGNLAFTLLQYDPSGELIFQHRFGDKWRLAGNHCVAGFQHEKTCNAFMDDLRQCWRVLRRVMEKLSAADRRRIEELAEAPFELIHPGYNRWPIQLAPSGYLSRGWSTSVFLWWVERGELVLAGDDGRPTCRLREDPTGTWEGRSLRHPKSRMQLIPQLPVISAERLKTAAGALT